jgi:hypothetical protein
MANAVALRLPRENRGDADGTAPASSFSARSLGVAVGNLGVGDAGAGGEEGCGAGGPSACARVQPYNTHTNQS